VYGLAFGVSSGMIVDLNFVVCCKVSGFELFCIDESGVERMCDFVACWLIAESGWFRFRGSIRANTTVSKKGR
jgi:hypothetical protein